MIDNQNSRQDAKDAGERLVSAHASEDPFAAAFKATRMPMLITDPRQPDNPIIFCNKAFCTLTGYEVGELIDATADFCRDHRPIRTPSPNFVTPLHRKKTLPSISSTTGKMDPNFGMHFS